MVAAFPGLAQLYERIGLPVNLRGLTFQKVEMFREVDNAQPVLVVEGEVENPTSVERPVPAIRFALRGDDQQEIYAWSIDPKTTTLSIRHPCPLYRAAQSAGRNPMSETSQPLSIEVLYPAEAVAERTHALAAEIRRAGFQDNVLVVAVLKGSFVFAADLIRALHHAGVSPQVDFISLSSYRAGTTSSGTVSVLRDLETDVGGRDVLIVDDILESGRTLAF
eukprot:gene38688-46863_t